MWLPQLAIAISLGFIAIETAIAEPAKPLQECLPETPLPAGALDEILALRSEASASGAGWGPGAWYGTWEAIDDTCHTFLVLSVEQDRARVVYSIAEASYPASFEEIDADIDSDGNLTFSVSWGANLIYRRDRSGAGDSLIATYEQGGRWSIEMRPIDRVP